jgi:C-terminal processing protease CtpA/Prc
MSTDRTRKGLTVKEPYVFRGYYNDITGEASIKLLEEKGYIQWRTRLEAKKDPRPYFILVDDRCGSACELFAAIAQENGGAKIVGVRTMGALLAGEAFKLKWQGFALVAPTAQVFSPKGNTIEGVGVEPDIEIPECNNSGNQCLERALEVVATNAK